MIKESKVTTNVHKRNLRRWYESYVQTAKELGLTGEYKTEWKLDDNCRNKNLDIAVGFNFYVYGKNNVKGSKEIEVLYQIAQVQKKLGIPLIGDAQCKLIEETWGKYFYLSSGDVYEVKYSDLPEDLKEKREELITRMRKTHDLGSIVNTHTFPCDLDNSETIERRIRKLREAHEAAKELKTSTIDNETWAYTELLLSYLGLPARWCGTNKEGTRIEFNWRK